MYRELSSVIAGMTRLSQSWYTPAAKSRHLGNLLEHFKPSKGTGKFSEGLIV